MTEIAEKMKKKSHGRTLRVLRNGADLTQEALADLTGLSQKTIWRLETEDIIPQDKLQIFANVFGVSVEFFDKFSFADADKNFVYNNHASNSDNATEISANEQENITIHNPDSASDLKEAYQTIGDLREQIGILKTENKMLKSNKK